MGLLGGGAGDVVRDAERAGGYARGGQLLGRLAEVEDVAGVVPVGEQDTAARLGGLGDPADLVRGGRGEDVADRRAVREALAHQAGEGRVVAGPAADDDGDLAGDGTGGPDHPARDPADPAGVGGGEAFEGLVGEGGGVVGEAGHHRTSARGRPRPASRPLDRLASHSISAADMSMKAPTRNSGR